MNQLLILSGKGGTGKTTVAGAFIRLAGALAYADCDVDAPNLHLLMSQAGEPKRNDFWGMPKAKIDPLTCIHCDLCRQKCRFGAIEINNSYKVNTFACEGCGVCQAVCPVNAVTMKPGISGELILYCGDTVFSTAQLKMGSGASGKLVTEVKRQLVSEGGSADLAIIDGSPGIGCPVIASLCGADMVLIVAEPSISGISDMERIIRTAQRFKIKIAVCINRSDTNTQISERIEAYCRGEGLYFTGKIPYDPEVVTAVNTGRTIVDIDCEAGRAVKEIYRKTVSFLNNIDTEVD